MAVPANAEQPMSGYRVAKVAGLPRQKVYPEIRRGVDAGLVVETPSGFRLADADVRALLRKRVRIRWTEDWDRPGGPVARGHGRSASDPGLVERGPDLRTEEQDPLGGATGTRTRPGEGPDPPEDGSPSSLRKG